MVLPNVFNNMNFLGLISLNGVEQYKDLYGIAMKMTIMQIGQLGVSVFLAAPAIYIVLSNGYPAQEKNWAFTTLGTILGFWLRGRQ